MTEKEDVAKRGIYIVEDDHEWAECLQDILERGFSGLIKTIHIQTHHDFIQRFNEIAEDRPAGIILDVMLKWTDTAISAKPPNLNSYMQAGLECSRMLQNDSRTREIPILIYTVLDRPDLQGLPRNAVYLRKDERDASVRNWVKGVLQSGVTARS